MLQSVYRRFSGANAQLVTLISIIFVVPMFDAASQTVAYKIGYTLLLIVTGLSLHAKRKTLILLIVAGLIVITWLASQLSKPIMFEISQTSKAIYFFIIVIALIRQTAAAKKVTEQVIVGAISGYLLLGMVFSIGTLMIAHWNAGAYNFSTGTQLPTPSNTSDFIYYTFTTFTTTGYGDLLPIDPIAKSFSIFTAAAGQLYIATIISLLVGKYAGSALHGSGDTPDAG